MTAKTISLIVVVVLSFGTWANADDCNSLRYADNGNGTVIDCRTGLVWLKKARCLSTSGGINNSVGVLNWHDAMKWAAGLGNGLCGLTDGSAAGDWRLPTKYEWMTMIENAKKQNFTSPPLTNAAGTLKWTNGDIFTDVQTEDIYWSGTSVAAAPDFASYVYFFTGLVSNAPKFEAMNVWPVRGGQTGAFGNLRIE